MADEIVKVDPDVENIPKEQTAEEYKKPVRRFLQSFDQVQEAIKQYERTTSTKFSAWMTSTFQKDSFSPEKRRIKFVDIDGSGLMPYCLVGKKVYDCKYGKDRRVMSKARRKLANVIQHMMDSQVTGDSKKPFISRDRESQKFGCPAQIKVMEIMTFPDYKVTKDTEYVRKTISKDVRRKLKSVQDVNTDKLYSVSFPDVDSHENHTVGETLEKMKRKRKRKLEEQTTKHEEVLLEGTFDLETSLQTDNISAETTRTSDKLGTPYTISIALPGSILENAQSPQLRTYLAGQIARALVIFNIDEVIVFRETPSSDVKEEEFKGSTKATDANILLARILQYLECPQYLRKHLFLKHPDLQFAGLLNPLDCPHHMRMEDDMPFREGVVLDRPVKDGRGSFVYVGMRKDVCIDKHLKPGIRVTVEMTEKDSSHKYLKGKVVAPSQPRTDAGLYWGYTVRLASSFGAVFTQSPYSEGYDLTIGTSERGYPVESIKLSPFRHCLVVFGGLNGLEASLESDETIFENDPSLLFDHYLNTCGNQGSRTIRTEEAILITMSALRPKILDAY